MIVDSAAGERDWRRVIRFPLLAPVVAAFFCGCKTIPPPRLADLGPLLQQHPEQFGRLLAASENFRVQVLVSEVGRDGRLQRSGYRVDAEYFYPASSIKLCAAVAALQTIEQLRADTHSPDLLNAPLEIAPLFPGDPPQRNDPSNSAGGTITVAHELRKLALVSDNQSFNRLFELVGHAGLNRHMHELGLKSVVINHRLSEPRAIPDPTASAAVKLFPPKTAPVEVPARTSVLRLTNHARNLLVGNAQIKGGNLVQAPMDFTSRNGISLVDLQDLLIKLVRPDLDLGTPPLKLEKQHRDWLVRAMTGYPRESTNPVYSAEHYPDAYSKFLLPGIRRVFPSTVPGERIEVTGKNGQAYGFSVENSCSYNPKNGRTVFVTAAIYANADGILNDDKYDYGTIAEPFMAALGELVARHWLSGN